MTTKIYVVDDHPLVRDVVTAYLARIEGVSVCGSACSSESALAEIGTAQPSIALVDLSLPRMSGIELTAAIRTRWPDVRVVVLSGHRERHYLAQALAAGACAYVSKDNPRELRAALEAVHRGEPYVSPAVSEDAPEPASREIELAPDLEITRARSS